MNLSIVKKVNLLSVCIILVFGPLLGWYFIRHESNALRAEMDERASVILDSLAISSEYPVLINDQESIARLVKGVLKQKDVVFCRVENQNGELLFQEGILKSESIKVYERFIKTKTEELGLDEQMIYMKVKDEEEEIGKIMLTVSLSGLNKKIEDITRTILVFVIVTILLASLASSLLLKVILSNPINMLVKGTERIAKGDLSHKVLVKTKDEIGKLATAFNKMTNDLQRLTVSRDYVDNIINSMNDTLIVINPDTTIRTVNYALMNLLGYKEDEIIGKKMNVLLADDISLFKGEEWEDLLQKGSIQDYDMDYITKDGESIPVSFSGSVMKDEAGNIISIVGMARDMREVIKLKKQLFQTEKMAAVGQLAGGVAHEINNPMSVILGFAQTVSRRVTDKTDPFYLPLRSIEREAIRCKKLVGDLLTFSRVSKTEREVISVSALIDETLSLIESKCRIKGVELKREVPADLPAVMANKNQIQQVIVNLCNNGIDAIDGTGTLTIAASVEEKGKLKNVAIKVIDTGHGIPPDIKERIFEPFFTTKEVGKGTGLGLGISYEIIQKHGGNIEVASEEGKGSTFIISLPVKQQEKFAGI